MDNLEAIYIIQNYQINPCGYCHEGGSEVEEAFNMAVKALMEADGNKLANKSYLYDEHRYDNMPEHVRETYRVLVGICNTLNAKFGVHLRRYYISKNEEELNTSFLLERAQKTIMCLLEETGRLDEYDKWIKEQREGKV